MIRFFFALCLLIGLCVNASASLDAQRFLNTLSVTAQSIGLTQDFRFDARAFQSLTHSVEATHSLHLDNFPVGIDARSSVTLRPMNLPFDQHTIFLSQNSNGEVRTAAPHIQMWQGSIDAESGSEIIISSSALGFFCSVKHSNDLRYSFSSDPNDQSLVHGISEKDNTSPLRGLLRCETGGRLDPGQWKQSLHPMSNNLLEVNIAIETDTRFFDAAGGSLDKAQSYITALLAMVNVIYEREVNVRLYLSWLKCWTDAPADPYNCGGDPFVLGDRARPHWDSVYKDVPRNIYHVVTSVSYGGGGYGFLDKLCGDFYSMASSSLQVQHTYPTLAFTYDSYIMAHEIGHNFGAPHTHSCDAPLTVPLDTCVVDASNLGKCLDSSVTARPNPGSIMSYCGGPNNSAGLGYQVRMTFLPPLYQWMRSRAEASSCVSAPPQASIVLVEPAGSADVDVHQPVRVSFLSTRVTSVDILYSRGPNEAWQPIVQNMSVDSGVYYWTPPDTCTNSMRLRVQSTSDTSVFDESPIPFHLFNTAPVGLVAAYDFDGDLKNRICGGFDDARVAEGTVRFVPGRLGAQDSAIQISGNGYLYVPSADLRGKQLAVSLWCSADSAAGKNTIIGTNPGPATNVFEIYDWGLLGCSYYLNNGLWQFWSGGLSLHKWTHVVFSFDGDTAKTWVDARLVKAEYHPGTLVPFVTELYIGARRGVEYFYGQIDDIRIFNRALTDNDVYGLNHEGLQDVAQDYAVTSSCMKVLSADDGHVSLLLNQASSQLRWTLYTMLGQQLAGSTLHNVNAGPCSLHLPNVSAGAYLLHVESDDCSSTTTLLLP